MNTPHHSPWQLTLKTPETELFAQIPVLSYLPKAKSAPSGSRAGHAAHIGQLFFDQDLIFTIEATYPYNTNSVSITSNTDGLVVFICIGFCTKINKCIHGTDQPRILIRSAPVLIYTQDQPE